MTYGVIVTVPAPVEMYDGLHAELMRTPVEGLLVHLARPTTAGFEVIEVWESQEQCDRYTREVVWPLAARLADGGPPAPEPTTEEFEVRGLVTAGETAR